MRVVAFRASHPAKPPSRQRSVVQRLLKVQGKRTRCSGNHFPGIADLLARYLGNSAGILEELAYEKVLQPLAIFKAGGEGDHAI